MSVLGHIEEFDECSSSSFEEYIERLECFFHANDIVDDAKKRSVLLSVCGAKTYSMLRSVIAPTQPSTVTYANIVAALKHHYSPAPSEVVQRFHFHNCKQKPNQSVSNYIAELRHAMLRDRIVCGVLDEALQRRLLAEPTLTFKEAEERALAAETALPLGVEGVHRVQFQTMENILTEYFRTLGFAECPHSSVVVKTA
uniref:Paraneoplastic antigen Ma-like C-terminal domain-containing protein n=1 Tax=Paramormyrops kingsleyae TaxID=1676925 RepID=A0A3B3R993_9TELE